MYMWILFFSHSNGNLYCTISFNFPNQMLVILMDRLLLELRVIFLCMYMLLVTPCKIYFSHRINFINRTDESYPQPQIHTHYIHRTHTHTLTQFTDKIRFYFVGQVQSLLNTLYLHSVNTE